MPHRRDILVFTALPASTQRMSHWTGSPSASFAPIATEPRTSYIHVPRAMMYCAAAKLHGVENKGAQPLLFCFYKWRA